MPARTTNDVCTFYYAIVPGSRLEVRQPFTVEVTTTRLGSDPLPATIRAVEPA